MPYEDTTGKPELDYECATSAEYKRLTEPSRQVRGRAMPVNELRDGYDHRPIRRPASVPLRASEDTERL
jgi:hypothetical protein